MKTLGKYEILEELGSGGMGIVYRARDTVLEREVAIKTICTGADVDPELKQRFYREARACARLQHPNIVTVYDLGEEEGTAYIAMELLAGADLRRIISEKRPFPLETKIELLAQVCEGLAHAHRNGIVHRDVKPGNIFIQEGDGAKILDFGVARVTASRLTRVGAALGTPDYMAPEQIAGQTCEARTDLFSAALVFFEFLAYVHPFRGPAIARRIVREEPDSLCAANPLLPASLEQVIAKGLEKNPERRYQAGDEFAAALRGVKDELRHTAAVLYQKAESLRAEILAGRRELGELGQCQKVMAALQEAGMDESVLDNWPQPGSPGTGCLELNGLVSQLQQLGRAQEKALGLARESLQSIQNARERLQKGDVEGGRQLIELVETDFPDHPQVPTLRAELAAAGRQRPAVLESPELKEQVRAPLDAAEPAGEPAGRIEAILPRLQQALEEHDPSLVSQIAGQLRPLVHDLSESMLRLQAEKALLGADFELARANFLQMLQDSDIWGAEEEFRRLEGLPVREPRQIEGRERCRAQLEEVRRGEEPSERRMSDFLRTLHEFDAAIDQKLASTARPALDRMKRLAAVDERFAVAVSECEKRLGELQPEAAAPRQEDPILAALRRRAAQLFEQDYRKCVEFVESLGRQQQADPEIAGLKERAVAELERVKRETAPVAPSPAAPPAPSVPPVPEAATPTPPPARPDFPPSPFQAPVRFAQPAAPSAPPVEAPPPAAPTPSVTPAPPAPPAPPPAAPVTPRPQPSAEPSPGKPPTEPGLKICAKCGTGNLPTHGFCKGCGSRLGEPPRPAAKPAAPAFTPAEPIIQAESEARERSDATWMFSATGPHLPAKPPAAPPPAAPEIARTARPPLAASGRPDVSAARPAVTPVPASRPAPSPAIQPRDRVPSQRPALAQPGLKTQHKVIIAAAAVAVLAVAGWIAHRMIPRPVRLEQAVAAAEVTSSEAQIFAAPDRGADLLVALKKGDRLNVLRLPRSRDQEWVEVQHVTAKKRFPPGYAQRAEVGNWWSDKPDAAFSLLKVFGPGEAAIETEIRDQMGKLAAFVGRFGDSAQAPEANFELARFNLTLARLGKEAGQPSSDWQPYLEAAAGQLSAAYPLAGADLAAQVQQARQELEGLKSSGKSTPEPAAAQPRRPEELVKRAAEAYNDGRYDDAERFLNRVLRDDRQHKQALELLERVRRAKQLESKAP